MSQYNILKSFVLVGQLGLTMLSAIFAGGLTGYFLIDKPLNTFPKATILCLLLGVIAGFMGVYKLILKALDDDSVEPNQ